IVGKGLEYVPGLKGVGKAYQGIGKAAEGLQLIYELVHELKQAEALEKGGKKLVKEIKPVKVVADNLLKKKFPELPEPLRKKAAGILEDLFEKYFSDPALEKGAKKARELDKDNDLDSSLWDELKKALGGPTTLP